MTQAHTLFQSARIIRPDGETSAAGQDWTPHPAFPGVWMKNLVSGKDTAGTLSCHLVRVEEGRAIGLHAHEASCELHEVLAGEGVCGLEGREVRYCPGTCMVIPAGARHEVSAREGDLLLMARFAPALV